MIKDVYERLRKVDLVLVSAGGLAADSTIHHVDLISAADARSLKEAGAVGDLCAHWLDVHGRLVDHPLNKRAVGLSPLELKSVPCVIVASGSADKVEVLHGALEGGMVDILITDEATASYLLNA